VKSYLGFYRQLIQSGLMESLDLDETRQHMMQFVLEQSMTQVLQRLTREEHPDSGRGAGHAQFENNPTSRRQNQLNDFDEFTRVIDSHMGPISYQSEGTTFTLSNIQLGSPHNPMAEGELALGYVSAQPSLMPAPFSQRLYGLPPQDDVATFKLVDDHVILPAWHDTSFAFPD
jgi:hypothetical protein